MPSVTSDPAIFARVAAMLGCQPPLCPAAVAHREPSVIRIPSGIPDLDVALHHLAPADAGPGSHRPPVLFVHGATFPTELAAGYRFDAVSWLDELAAEGFDVWGLDFLGYGRSDRYPEMAAPASDHPPLGRADVASRQIAAAVARILAACHATQLSIVAHSWGTLAAGRYAVDHPAQLDRLVLFGPVAARLEPADADADVDVAWYLVTEADQQRRFYGYVPAGEPPAMAPRHFESWGPAYLASDPSAATRTPPSARVPAGPLADIGDAWSGRLPYDPARITAPTLIVRGAWDDVTRDADAARLFDALSAARLRRDVKIDRATHVMHLERTRRQLYREVSSFLAAGDE
jgi:pimeloyl-ACP methyl ester carboxylesterase